MAYRYGAIPEARSCGELIRISDEGVIEQYDLKSEKWRDADSEMYDIYSGDVEYDQISEEEANMIIKNWLQHVK